MRILLDTCTFLWVGADASELSAASRQLFQDPDNELYLSSVSAWEIAVKVSLGRLSLPKPLESYVASLRKDHGIEPLSLEEADALQLPRLPDLHRDPFDRMLVCQAIVHGLTILTPDRLIAQYPVRTLW